MKSSFLISFEGIDGSGKSTQAVLLKEKLEKLGCGVVLYREPGGTPLSEAVRNLLLDTSLEISPFAELLLFSAARAELVSAVIKPALERGDVVILDRFYDSTVAYQGAGRQLTDRAWLDEFNTQVTGGLKPDRTYFIAVSLDTASGRTAAQAPDRMERTGKSFFDRVATAYEEISSREPHRVTRIDGENTVDEIHDEIWEDVKGMLEKRGGTVASGGGKATDQAG